MADQDPVADYLRTVPGTDRMRAAAWDAVYAQDDTDAEQRLRALPVGDDVRAKLWDLRKPSSAPPREKDFGDWIEQDLQRGVANLYTGVAKGIGNTVFGLGKIARDYTPIGYISDAIQPGTFDERPKELEPKGTMQRLGFTGEQVGEFMLLPAATKGPLAAKMLAGATEAGALTAAQGGQARDVALSALPGAAAPLAGAMRATLQGGAKALEASAGKNVSQAFDPTGKRDKALVEQITPGVLDRGLWSATKEGLKGKAETALDALSDQYDDVAKTIAPGNRIPVDDVRQPIQSAMQSLVRTGSSGAPVPVNVEKYEALKQLDDTLGQLGDKVSHQTLQAFKEEWADVVAKSGGYAERTGDALAQASAWAKRKGADAIRRVLAADAPNKDALNAEWKFWSTVDDVLSNTLSRTKPQKGAMRRMAGVGGAIIGGAKGGPAGAGIGAATMSQVMRAMDSPGWKLLNANAKMKLADALMSANPDRVGNAIGRVLAAMPATTRQLQASH